MTISETEPRLTCEQVATYFLTLEDENAGDLISNLKLQKLVYYAQGFHLTLFGYPLFAEPIEAWTHGPVVPSLYRKYSKHRGGSLPKPVDVDFSVYDDEVKELLNEVYTIYGQYSAWRLRDMTHDDPPWCEAKAKGESAVISQEAMQQYFATRVES